nr:uncharacterized protein LOC127310655 [Lolium perenne]
MLCLHAGVRFAGHVGRRARRHSGLPAWNRHALPGRRRRRPERGHQPVPVPQCGQQLRPGEPVVQAGDQQQERRCQGNAALAAAPQATELQASCRTTAAHRHRPPTKTSCASSYGRKFSPLISHARLI